MELPFILRDKYFKVISNENGKVEAECLLCQPHGGNRRLYKGFIDVTTNFLTHLKRKHPDEHLDFENRRKVEGKRRKVADNSSMSFDTFLAQDKSKSLTKEEKLLVNFTVKGMHPLSIVEEPGFIEYSKGLNPNFTAISRRTLCRKLEIKFSELHDEMVAKFSLQPFISLTADIWTCKGMTRSFLGVTAHFINKHLERQSFAIACRRFRGSHTYDRIAALLSTIMKEYGLGASKVPKITTDNARNFLKAFKEFKSYIPDEDVEDMDQEYEFPSVEEVFSTAFSATESEDNEEDVIVLPNHQACAAHTLNLVCTTDIGKEKSKIHRAALGKCYGIWNKIAKSTMAHESMVEICGCSLKTPVLTRWNSLFNSIKSLLASEDKLDDVCEKIKTAALSDREKLYLKEYVECVEPIAKGLDILQGEHNTFYGVLIPILLAINFKLKKLQEKNFELCKTVVPLLLDGLQKRFGKFLSFHDDVTDAILAAIAHPKFKLTWIPADKQQQFHELFVKEVATHQSTQAPLSMSTSKTNQSDSMYDDFYEFLTPSIDLTNPRSTSAEDEVKGYLHNPMIELSMLEEFPAVKKAFIKLNTPLPSSASVERLFNYSNMILTPNRRNTSDSNFEMQLLLKINN